METYLIAFTVFGLVTIGMAIGVIISNRRIKGSCGGLSAWKDELGKPMCDACADDPEIKQSCELELARIRAAEAAARSED